MTGSAVQDAWWHERRPGLIDAVRSSISFSLVNSARVLGACENLTLTGVGNINATGNSLNNILTGKCRRECPE
jgi:hypothetical protein